MFPGRNRLCGMFAAAFFAFCLFSLCAGAGETGGGEAGFKPDFEQIRRDMSARYRRIADSYIAEHVDAQARARVQLIVGALYETGQMGDPDAVRAAEYYREAAETGMPEALAALANVYNQGAETGSGRIPRDPARARELYEQAAAAGSVPGMLALGIIYADGMNVDPDSKRALSYLVDAAQRGDATALERLEPVMRKAREWEEAKAGRKGKAGFPTSREEMIKPHLVQAFIDRTFDLDRLASHTYVEINKRIKDEVEKKTRR